MKDPPIRVCSTLEDHLDAIRDMFSLEMVTQNEYDTLYEDFKDLEYERDTLETEYDELDREFNYAQLQNEKFKLALELACDQLSTYSNQTSDTIMENLLQKAR